MVELIQFTQWLILPLSLACSAYSVWQIRPAQVVAKKGIEVERISDMPALGHVADPFSE